MYSIGLFKIPLIADKMETNDLLDICTHLIEVAKEAGNMILFARPTSLMITTKRNSLYVPVPLLVGATN